MPLSKSLGLTVDITTLSLLKEEEGEKKLISALIDMIRKQIKPLPIRN